MAPKLIKVSFGEEPDQPKLEDLDARNMVRRIDRLEHKATVLGWIGGFALSVAVIVLGHALVQWMSARSLPPPPAAGSR